MEWIKRRRKGGVQWIEEGRSDREGKGRVNRRRGGKKERKKEYLFIFHNAHT